MIYCQLSLSTWPCAACPKLLVSECDPRTAHCRRGAVPEVRQPRSRPMTITASAPQTLLGPLLQSFFAEHLCSHKRLSPRTIESYRDTFRLLLQYLQAKTA